MSLPVMSHPILLKEKWISPLKKTEHVLFRVLLIKRNHVLTYPTMLKKKKKKNRSCPCAVCNLKISHFYSIVDQGPPVQDSVNTVAFPSLGVFSRSIVCLQHLVTKQYYYLHLHCF